MRRLAAAFAGLSAGRRGILWMLATTLAFVAMDAIGKYLSVIYPVMQVVWARFAFHIAAIVLLFGGRLFDHLATTKPALQAARAVFLLGSTAFGFLGLRVMPLADVAAIWTLIPIMVTAMSVPFLGEFVGPRRWVGVLAGFVGALVIVRPGLGVMQVAVVLPILSAICQALYNICTRALSSYDSALTTLFYTASVGLLVSTAWLPFAWSSPDAFGWALMVALGALGGLGHFMLIKSFQAAPAATVIPFNYAHLVWATVIGFTVFGDFPDAWTLGGAALIIASGLYIFHREQARRGAAEP